MSTLDDVLELAASHGLRLLANGATVVEAGLDYRVIMSTDETQRRYALTTGAEVDRTTAAAMLNPGA